MLIPILDFRPRLGEGLPDLGLTHWVFRAFLRVNQVPSPAQRNPIGDDSSTGIITRVTRPPA